MNKLFFILSALLLISYGCNKAEENIPDSMPAAEILANDDISMTSEISKIVTIYEEGMEKYEGKTDEPKIETAAPQEMIDKIRKDLEESYSKQVSYAKNAGNLVAVFKGTSCGTYEEMRIHMDCEDRNGASGTNDYVGASYVNSGQNVVMELCIIDYAYFERTQKDYAILNLTAQLPGGVSRFVRYFDNEDNGNINSIDYYDTHYTTYSDHMWIGDNFFGTDTRLSFFYYPKNTSSANVYPSLGFSYHVLGSFGDYTGTIYSDDEDNGSISWFSTDLWNGYTWNSNTWYASSSSGIAGVITADRNTTLYLSRVN